MTLIWEPVKKGPNQCPHLHETVTGKRCSVFANIRVENGKTVGDLSLVSCMYEGENPALCENFHLAHFQKEL